MRKTTTEKQQAWEEDIEEIFSTLTKVRGEPYADRVRSLYGIALLARLGVMAGVPTQDLCQMTLSFTLASWGLGKRDDDGAKDLLKDVSVLLARAAALMH